MQNKTLSTLCRLCLDAVAHGGNPQDRAASLSHQRKLVLGVKMMENKHESEINLVRDLIELLDLTGVVFTFDALHCQKADATPRRRQAFILEWGQGNAHQAKPYQRSPIQVMTI